MSITVTAAGDDGETVAVVPADAVEIGSGRETWTVTIDGGERTVVLLDAVDRPAWWPITSEVLTDGAYGLLGVSISFDAGTEAQFQSILDAASQRVGQYLGDAADDCPDAEKREAALAYAAWTLQNRAEGGVRRQRAVDGWRLSGAASRLSPYRPRSIVTTEAS